jgi:gamma-glutamylcyclotransferase (GGCT)/AIG2-like uncharacterized protein YtfP
MPMENVDTALPFFAYGFLRPGEIGYLQIERFVDVGSVRRASVSGQLWLRDGLLLLEPTGDSLIEGFLLRFRPDQAEAAYRTIDELEPYKLYRWDTAEVSIDGSTVKANVLFGRSPQSGSELWRLDDWHVADDPLFNEALQEIESIATEPNPADPTEPRVFFRKQMAYLLLWSSIERYASLRWGFGGQNVTKRVERLAEEPAFRNALAEVVKQERRVRRTDDPSRSSVLDRARPLQSIRYYYQVRSNMVHRGKAAIRDRQIVEGSLHELLHIYKHVLDETLPR